MEVLKALKKRQQHHLLDAILSLHQYALYSTIDSSLAVDGKVDKMVKDLEEIVREQSIK